MKAFIKIIVALGILFTGIANAQDYSIAVKNAKKVDITNLTGVIKIVGHNGSDISVTASGLEDPPERAKGLKPISGGGVDNSGIGLNVTEVGNVISISGASKRSADADYVFKIPNSLAVKVDYSSPFTSGDVQVEDFGGEFEMEALNDGVSLKNVTGPVYLDLINGDIDIVFESLNQESPMSLKTINGEVDVTFPASSKANLDLYSLHGDIYTDLDIDMEKSKDQGSGMKFIGGSSKVEGTINGGGVDVKISTINGNLYLRKK